MRASVQPSPRPDVAASVAAPAPAPHDLPTLVARPAGHHGHLWVLLDGTPAHAPPGLLTLSPDGELACHLCGRWFIHLGAHVRRHGWTAAAYREAVGLDRHTPLCSQQHSRSIAERQRVNWHEASATKAAFEASQQAARSGELAERARTIRSARESSRAESPYVVDARARRLGEGRATVRARREAHLTQLVATSGARDLHDLLRTSYAGGASLESLAALTGLGRARLSAELDAAQVQIRRSGHNLPASKRVRAVANDRAVARRVGAEDVREWLLQQRVRGRTLDALARATGRSVPWVRSRLKGTTTTQVKDGKAQASALR